MLLDKYKLNNQISGMTSIKSTITSYYSEMARDRFVAFFTLALMAVELIFLVAFVLGAFLARKRFELAIRILHGISLTSILVRFVFINGMGDIVLVAISLFLKFNWVSLGFGAALIFIEISLLLFFARQRSANLVSTLNQGM